MKRFEYNAITVFTDENGELVFSYKHKEVSYFEYIGAVINIMGNEGWELVSVMPMIGTSFEKGVANLLHPVDTATISSNVQTTGMIYHFKRELDENDEVVLNGDIFEFLENIDNEYEEEKIKQQELIKEREEEKKRKKNALLEKDNIINSYLEKGYIQTVNYPQRIVFEQLNKKKNSYDEVRYDLIDGLWVVKNK